MTVNAFAAVLTVLTAGAVAHRLQKKRQRLPPGPPSYPLVGQLLSAPFSFEHLGYKRLSDELKSASVRSGWRFSNN